jgi:medium-chain acyl-[acyl-carrier-protein] hydrolase
MRDNRYPRADPWIRFHMPDPRARLRLFCFPYAGGGASIYRGWIGRFPSWVDVCPVQLPGREERIREPAFTHMDALCAALLPTLAPYLDQPVALFGHSMGALIAYQLATRLHDPENGPVHLLVSGQRAPHLPLGRPPSYNLPDAAFAERLRDLNGTPAPVLQNPELMELVRPLLRADFELSECTPRERRDLLDCPITAFGGLADREIERPHLEAWRETTRGAFDLHMLPGDHFYLAANEAALTALVAECLAVA